MKIKLEQLKKIIREEYQNHVAKRVNEESEPATTGKDIKGSTSSEKAGELLGKNKALMSIIDKITTKDALADFLQTTLKLAAEKGIDQSEAEGALKKVLGAMKQ